MTRNKIKLLVVALIAALSVLIPTMTNANALVPVQPNEIGCTHDNGCKITFSPAYPGSPGTAAIPDRKVYRPASLGAILGGPGKGKYGMVQWLSRYSSVWCKKPEFNCAFQSGSWDSHDMAVIVFMACWDIPPNEPQNGGDWVQPSVFMGSGGSAFEKKIVAHGRKVTCNGKPQEVIGQADWSAVHAGYRLPNRHPYFDIVWSGMRYNIDITAQDGTVWYQ